MISFEENFSSRISLNISSTARCSVFGLQLPFVILEASWATSAWDAEVFSSDSVGSWEFCQSVGSVHEAEDAGAERKWKQSEEAPRWL